MAAVVMFDVNGTLLDLSALDPCFDAVGPGLRRPWFHELQVLWMADMLTGGFRPFSELSRTALTMAAARIGVDAPDDAGTRLVDSMTRLPPFPDVAPGLDALAAAGARLVALTNGARDSASKQLQHAGLLDRFEAVLSAEDVRRYKPAPEAYRHALQVTGASPETAWLVAAHAWDVRGATAAGLRALFLEREGEVPDPALSAEVGIIRSVADVAQRVSLG